VAEVVAGAPFLASARLDQQKFRNALHELVLHFIDSEKRTAFDDFCAILHTLLDHEINVNETDFRGNTPLMLLCDHPGYTEAIDALCDAKVDLDVLNASHQTALHKAVIGGWEPDITALLKKGADPNLMDSKGLSPLHWALMSIRAHHTSPDIL
jgi:ankyrin repeat protein